MTYKIDFDLLEKGIKEALKVKINQLESLLEDSGNRNVDPKVAVEEYLQTRDVAKSFLVETIFYDDILLKHSQELKRRYGIEIK